MTAVTGPEAGTGKFLAAQWRRLVMLNYEADPAILRPLVPRGVELDTWHVWQATDPGLECDVEEVYGRRFVEPLAAEPVSAFIADGSPVTVRRGTRI